MTVYIVLSEDYNGFVRFHSVHKTKESANLVESQLMEYDYIDAVEVLEEEVLD